MDNYDLWRLALSSCESCSKNVSWVDVYHDWGEKAMCFPCLKDHVDEATFDKILLYYLMNPPDYDEYKQYPELNGLGTPYKKFLTGTD